MKIKAKEKTRIKLNPTAAPILPPTEFFILEKDETLEILTHEDNTLDHYELTLASAVEGNTIWYVLKKHVDII